MKSNWIPYNNGKNVPLTEGDGKEYLIRGEKATDSEIYEYVVCWFDGHTFFTSHGYMNKYEDNADLMQITHWCQIIEP